MLALQLMLMSKVSVYVLYVCSSPLGWVPSYEPGPALGFLLFLPVGRSEVAISIKLNLIKLNTVCVCVCF